MADADIIFYILIFIVASIYSSVGHGGASGYLAIMAVWSVSPEQMRASALTLNLFVAGISFISYWRGGHYKKELSLPLIALSVPMSFLGATIQLEPKYFKMILGIFLVIAVGRLLSTVRKPEVTIPISYTVALTAGVLLGFVSGLIGIGGGIILSPLLLLFRWATIKEAAAVSALFILLNSSAGIAGLITGGFYKPVDEMYLMIVPGIAGSFAGAFLGKKFFSPIRLKCVLASVLILASMKLFII